MIKSKSPLFSQTSNNVPTRNTSISLGNETISGIILVFCLDERTLFYVALNSGFCSRVCWIKPRSAAHLVDDVPMLSAVVASVPLIPSVDAAAVLPAICAIFLSKPIPLHPFQFLLPLHRTGPTLQASVPYLGISRKDVFCPSIIGRAFASDSRLATRFFEGLLRFLLLELGFSILETNVSV
jgi:hypothetical protein